MCPVPVQLLLQILGCRAWERHRSQRATCCLADEQARPPSWTLGYWVFVLHVVGSIPETGKAEVCETKNKMGFLIDCFWSHFCFRSVFFLVLLPMFQSKGAKELIEN